ncbi:MAG: 2'-5' RNA ligase family protein [Cyclobacteriaceae bacterium]
MKEEKSLYFIAVVPPEPEREELLLLKKIFSEEYDTKAALRSPPHITLHMPFRFRRDREESLSLTLEKFFSQFSTFTVCLKGFGAFPPRVIYADVEENEFLQILQSELKVIMKTAFNIFNADYKERPFRPHMTLAFRDLKKPMFLKAWNKYREENIEMCWEVTHIALLRHTGKKWEILKEMELKSV